MKRPWMPLYIGDYRANTGHLNAAQHGAYLLLLMHYWEHEGLPDDDRQLARITSMSLKEWRRHRPVIEQFFEPGWVSRRSQKEIIKAKRVATERQIAGQKGGLKSAISRMNLEYRANSGQAIAAPIGQAKLDHSQSHKEITTTDRVERGEGPSNGKPLLAASASLLASLQRRR